MRLNRWSAHAVATGVVNCASTKDPCCAHLREGSLKHLPRLHGAILSLTIYASDYREQVTKTP